MGSAASAQDGRRDSAMKAGYPQLPVKDCIFIGRTEPETVPETVPTQYRPTRVVAYNAEQWEARFGKTCRELKKQETVSTMGELSASSDDENVSVTE
eukprot:Skav215200  [mRNA]  locus=scaffold2331:38805:43292:- [translate_table: standard]